MTSIERGSEIGRLLPVELLRLGHPRRRLALQRDLIEGGCLQASVPLLVIDDPGMRKLPATAAEDLLELVMRRYERASTLIASSRPVEDWAKLLGDAAAVTTMLDRLRHHAHVLKCGRRTYRTRHVGLQQEPPEVAMRGSSRSTGRQPVPPND